jgi:hypothetical protein
VTTYFYDDAGRVTRTATASPWTEEDRALMLAWRTYKDGLHKPCGHPVATAMHPDNGLGAFEKTEEIVCWACTAANEPDENGVISEVKFPVVVDVRDYEKFPLPPLD